MHFPGLSALACLLVALFSVQARAQESSWSRTFIPEAVGSYLPAGKQDFLIAAAGDVSANLSPAARALENAFRRSGRAGLVMDSASLGSLAGLDDAQIVRKAKALPINRVAVLRLFPAGPKEPWRAVVTLYDKAGNAVGAFSAVAGSPLEMAEERSASSPGEGVDARAAAEVAGQVIGYKPTSKAQETYDRLFVGFYVLDDTLRPFQGTGDNRRALNREDFYVAVERQDLADKYKRNDTTKLVISGLGFVTGLVGVGLMYYALMTSVGEDTFWSNKMIAGWTVAGAGLVIAVVPWFVSSHPVDAEGARRLIDKHNQKLRTKLGLPDEEGPKVSLTGSRLQLSPVAFASPAGAVFGVAGRF